MLFITNRNPKQSLRSKKNRPFKFDLDNNAPCNSVFFCKRNDDGSLVEIGSETFLTRVKASDHRQILIYIHGFSNLPESVFETTHKLQSLCNAKNKKEVLVIPIIWPCDNDLGIVKDYWDDQKAADQSRYSLSRVFHIFDKWRNDTKLNPANEPCLKRISVLGHSMGTRVLRGALSCWKSDLPDGVPLLFRNAFLIASDVVNGTLERGEEGEVICHASRNVVVYFASDDLALRASKAANLKNRIASRRLGHTGPENWNNLHNNVWGVDCDDINNDYDFPKGHSYFAENKEGKSGMVFDHLYDCLKTGRVHQKKRAMILSD